MTSYSFLLINLKGNIEMLGD